MIVDLVIPARNEAENIGALFEALPAGVFRRVVVGDNGSTDATAALVRERGGEVVAESRMGYGSACLAALGWIRDRGDVPDAVAFLDADLSDDPASLPELIGVLERGEANLAMGCRTRLADNGALDPHQRFGTGLACWLAWLTTGARYRDLGPMRVIRWEALERLEMVDRTWGWTIEMQVKAATRGVRAVEVDVPYRKRHAGRSKITGSLWVSARVGVRIIWTVGVLWWGERGKRVASATAGEITPLKGRGTRRS
ncbi:glycosyltransferase family 2 protein [Mucisphaera sp.]|uniref:glycosyltransferase family 2 protein n=1 Tax=Mucisphaera sp. TaxID=2913024 RepID=UPI003D1526D1